MFHIQLGSLAYISLDRQSEKTKTRFIFDEFKFQSINTFLMLNLESVFESHQFKDYTISIMLMHKEQWNDHQQHTHTHTCQLTETVIIIINYLSNTPISPTKRFLHNHNNVRSTPLLFLLLAFYLVLRILWNETIRCQNEKKKSLFT